MTLFLDPDVCKWFGITCSRCNECGYNGWCVTNVPKNSLKCLCDYGYTGANARYVPKQYEGSSYTRNRVRANDCNRKCTYTQYYRYN